MLFAYFMFCLGGAMLTLAAMRVPGRGDIGAALDSPPMFLHPLMSLIVILLGLVSFIAEIVVGVLLIGWLAGLFVWIPANILVGVTFRTRNPAGPFFIGLLVTIASAIVLANR